MLQVDSTGEVGFDDLISMGKVGKIVMRPPPEYNPVRELRVGNEDLKQAAEVVLGRLDIADLIGGSNVQYKAALVRVATVSTVFGMHIVSLHLSSKGCTFKCTLVDSNSCACYHA